MSELKIGDRVTVKVYERPAFNGIITGEGRSGHWWIIIKDGTKSKNGYAKDFCQPECLTQQLEK
ncbi:MAG: hypothetical protein KGI37_10975 [Alphaproteobacteria bacterium]|nr:hypothetical protein [Alphaproteobacteria bacterium]